MFRESRFIKCLSYIDISTLGKLSQVLKYEESRLSLNYFIRRSILKVNVYLQKFCSGGKPQTERVEMRKKKKKKNQNKYKEVRTTVYN